MIDWGLSGFQLASKPDNGISVSDSEYTVHRRPPLLMYIPGVSHHDRPAVEDDRLSALSDASRSEINDGLSSLASSTKGKNLSSDIRRRHSMPRDGKLKWMKWKTKDKNVNTSYKYLCFQFYSLCYYTKLQNFQMF
ncbi:uncharacterized protein CEXT_449841 [Caerostris extrusa]|uniref:Uncharacterized protein n=1 Tax=Caerostris extrusa TaxID=172846 RepID=A0AAV4SS03_CAEEX|nr:uncharacterized protein CEXT_449841 [Caerostris extrusa]